MKKSKQRSLFQITIRAELNSLPTPEARVALLRRYAQVIKTNRRTPEQIRREFNATWRRRSNPKHCRCAVCHRHGADSYHHAIQVKNGGDNHRSNLFPVCDPCHALIHPWLNDKQRPEAAPLAQYATR